MTKIFISYSHKDEKLKTLVCSHLEVLENLSVWSDSEILAGSDWKAQIEREIASCDLALLLVSVNFLNSFFIKNEEVPRLYSRTRDGLQIIPVIIGPCAWKSIPWLSRLEARPKADKTLASMRKNDRDAWLAKFSEEIGAMNTHGLNNKTQSTLLSVDRVDLTHLPHGAQNFLGRELELQQLDNAWITNTPVIELVAPGGVGKTALVKRWLEGLKRKNWLGAKRVYGWSFFSQGTSDDKQASEDIFIGEALQWFGISLDPKTAPADKGRRLAEAVASTRTLLILDGVEPLQNPPGLLSGLLRAPGIESLLTQLITGEGSGTCVLTTRERIRDLTEYERTADHLEGAVLRINLENLSDIDGAKLLHRKGVQRAGVAHINHDDEELQSASREVHGHALTLNLMGSFLAIAHDGDIRKRDHIDFHEADKSLQNGHAFKVMSAYEKWFQHGGKQSLKELATLRLLGFFDRPASKQCIEALCAKPIIRGLNEPIVGISRIQQRIVLRNLTDCGLVFINENDESLDAHPLVREYLARSLIDRLPEAWREGHIRLYKVLKNSTPHHPTELASLQPLFQAVTHGCLAKIHQEACIEIFYGRIRQKEKNYSIHKLGAFGADLGAVACFFDEPWNKPSAGLSKDAKIWLLNSAAYDLRALGRLSEAIEAGRLAAEASVESKNAKKSAVAYEFLSEVELCSGQISLSIDDAQKALKYAEESEDTFQTIVIRTALADALHQYGSQKESSAIFHAAAEQQRKYQPEHPSLYAIQGFRYRDLLLASVERLAWLGQTDSALALKQCHDVMEITRDALTIALSRGSALHIGLDYLTIGRCLNYIALLKNSDTKDARKVIEDSVFHLRAAAALHHLPRGLITRAWLRYSSNDTLGARADLDEAWRIASRGGMKLHQADICLYRARMFQDQESLHAAKSLIMECQYFRRLPEFNDVEISFSQS